MNKLFVAFSGLIATVTAAVVRVSADAFTDTSITIMEPFSGSSPGSLTINCSNTSCIFSAWISYYASASTWLFDVAVGVCIIWMIISGIRISISGDNAQLRDSAIGQMKASAFGLMILIFASPILKALNSVGFI